MIALGIDTGGTCTDAVLYDLEKKQVLDWAKTQTTKDALEKGIRAALKMLDRKILKKAAFVSLSTTLATNACVENRGGRVKLLLIGARKEEAAQVYRQYGFDSMSDLIFMEGVPENGFCTPREPDWEQLEAESDQFADCQAIGIVQLFPDWNHAEFEKKAKKILEKHYQVPIVCGSGLFSDRNILRRGAGTYLNVRLIPVIREFLAAVKKSLAAMDLKIPMYIVRSDGSLMNEEFAREHPVETLLCGPAASVLGGAWQSESSNALIIDMGGTTTDIGVIRGKNPVRMADGIRINHWKTFVKGMAIDTFGLGGDSAVRFRHDQVVLESFRVVPVSSVASGHPDIVGRMEKITVRPHSPYCPYEGLMLLKEPQKRENYSAVELEICDQLKRKGPMFLPELVEACHSRRIYCMTERLEKEEILIRFGLTPTDAMHVKGDFNGYHTPAARKACRMFAEHNELAPDLVPDLIYHEVKKKLYCNIVRILLEEPGRENEKPLGEEIQNLIANSFEEKGYSMVKPVFRTDFDMIGVGGPISVFLPEAAEKLGAGCVIPPDSKVANALGTLAGRVLVTDRREIDYYQEAYKTYTSYEKTVFEDYQEAEESTIAFLKERTAAEAVKRGAVGGISYSVSVEKLASDTTAAGKGILFGSVVTVEAWGNIGDL